jgi:hypothetical protein
MTPAPPPNDAKTARRASLITAALVIITLLVWGIWDLLVYLRIGGVATISTVIGDWQASSWFLGAPIALGMGVLCSHFLRMTPNGDPWQLLRWLIFAAGLAAGVAITPRS